MLEVAADPVQELNLEVLGSLTGLDRRFLRVLDQLAVMGTERRVAAIAKQPVGEVLVLRIDLVLALLRDVSRFGIRALDQPDPWLQRRHGFQIERSPS